jgi:hypothetical protein
MEYEVAKSLFDEFPYADERRRKEIETCILDYLDETDESSYPQEVQK